MPNFGIGDPVAVKEWFPVALGEELPKGEVKAATLLGEDLVLWRSPQGLHVWQDLCIHRGVRLSLGKITGDCRLRCAYHGWTYDEAGRCVSMPAHPSMRPPERARVKLHYGVEAAGLIWVSLADEPEAGPVLAEFSDPAFRSIPCGPYPAEAGAPRLIENFLDVAHLPIVHEGYLGSLEEAEILPYEVEWEEDRPLARNIRLYQPNPEGVSGAGMVSYEYGVLSPFAVYLRKKMEGGRTFSLLFSVVPVSETESRAWFCILVNYGDVSADRELVDFQEKIFAQDRPIVASQRPEKLPLDLAEELHLPSDRMAIAYRQYIRRVGLSFGTE